MKFINPSKIMCCDDVISCVFDFNDLDLNVYRKLKEVEESRADDLAKKLNKERSTVYRSLQKLTSCGLCIKKTNKIATGGYYHTYSRIDIKLVKKNVKSCIDDWYRSMKETIKMFDI
jgi:predicted transcriptional regulator